MKRSVRLPLQVGTSSLRSFAFAAASLLPSFLIGGWFVGVALLDHSENGGTALLMPIVEWMVVGGGILFFALRHLYLGLRERPSDILLSDTDLHVKGGRRHGLVLEWNQLEQRASSLDGIHAKGLRMFGGLFDVHAEYRTRPEVNMWRLWLHPQGRDRILLATAETKEEMASLEALRDSINAAARHATAESAGAQPVPKSSDPSVLSCTRCGAPATPTDQPAVTCAYCGTQVAVPVDLRERVHAALVLDDSRARSDKLVRSLLHQPGARRAGFAVTLATLPSMLAWPLVFGAGFGLWYAGEMNPLHVFCLLGVAGLCIAAPFSFVRSRLSSRRALRQLSHRFAALPPPRPGAPHRCRSCSAPLVEPPRAVLAHCVYCGADNVLGVDERDQAHKQTKEEAALEKALDAQHREHARWRNRSFASVVGLVASGGAAFAVTWLPHSLKAHGHAGELTRISYGPRTDKADPSVSPDGKVLLFDATLAKNRTQSSEYKADDAGDTILACGRGRCLDPTEFTPRALHGRQSRWLPGGSGIVYFTTSGKLQRTLAPAPLAKSELVVDVKSHAEVNGLDVSPDGKQVVYGTLYGIYIVGVHGGKPRKFTEGKSPVWSPDGQHIAFTADTGPLTHQVFVRAIKGSSPRRLHRDHCDQEDPAWSPDGAYLLFAERCSGVSRLCAVKSSGTGFEVLASGNAKVKTPVWSRDDVYFSALVADNYDIWRLHLGGPLAGHGRRRR